MAVAVKLAHTKVPFKQNEPEDAPDKPDKPLYIVAYNYNVLHISYGSTYVPFLYPQLEDVEKECPAPYSTN